MNPTTQAEIPGCLWMPADRSNYGLRPIYVVAYDLVVIHCTDGHADAMPVAQMWEEPVVGNDGRPRPSSAHIVVGQDGTRIQCVPLRFAAYHAHTANARSVGIEHCARTPGELGPSDPGLPPTDIQYQKSAETAAYLLKAAGQAVQLGRTIMGHAQADPKTTHTRCPEGCGWDWQKYITMVQAAYDQLGQPPALV